MTYDEKGTDMEVILQPVFERGFDGIGEMLSAVLKSLCCSSGRNVRLSAVLSEISEECETGKIYLSIEGMPA